MKFKAAIFEKPGQALVVDEVQCLDLQGDDVLVRIQASGLCHTDYEVMQGSLPYPLPIVLGHEGAGIVEAVGASVQRVKVGDSVVCSWNPFCGHCFYCTRNQPILCEPFSRHQPAGHLMDGTLARREAAPFFGGLFARAVCGGAAVGCDCGARRDSCRPGLPHRMRRDDGRRRSLAPCPGAGR
jgi:Zn-dependent alcohol dehydrogenase